MVVSTETEAYKNPKKEKPPFVPQAVKEESDDELIPDELSCGICEELVREPVRTPCCDRFGFYVILTIFHFSKFSTIFDIFDCFRLFSPFADYFRQFRHFRLF